jgi:lipopolysaccharide export system protein LptA
MKPSCLLAVLALVASTVSGAAFGATKSNEGSPLLPGGNSKAPVSIEADKLVYFDKDQKAIYSGNVVVIQGDTKMTCTIMTIFMEKAPAAAADAPVQTADASAAGGAGAAPSGETSRVRHMDAVGPVTVISKTQTATSDNGAYDKAQNKIWLTGHVVLSDGGNVTKGDKLTYDLTTGQATIDTGASNGRVKGQFIPGSSDPAGPAKSK